MGAIRSVRATQEFAVIDGSVVFLQDVSRSFRDFSRFVPLSIKGTRAD
jgi:hypothetical protein